MPSSSRSPRPRVRNTLFPHSSTTLTGPRLSAVLGATLGFLILFPVMNEPWIPFGGLEHKFSNAIVILILSIALSAALGSGLGDRILMKMHSGPGTSAGRAVMYGWAAGATIVIINWEILYVVGFYTGSLAAENDGSIWGLMLHVLALAFAVGGLPGGVGGLAYRSLTRLGETASRDG